MVGCCLGCGGFMVEVGCVDGNGRLFDLFGKIFWMGYDLDLLLKFCVRFFEVLF